MAPATAVDGRQPSACSPQGIVRPDNATPSGTPVCLSEKKKPRLDAGACWPSRLVEVGLIIP